MESSATDRPKKGVQVSALVTSYLMMPQDANPHGNVYGGTIMKYVDAAAAAVAERHCRTNTVTASIDRMDFFKPVYIGDLLTLKASVNYTGKTSLEIGVRIEAENLRSGEVAHTGSSYLTYVALDRDGKPTTVPEIVPETEVEKRRYKEAQERRKIRLIEAQSALDK
ncbi:MAG: acyl-CoA thioesterase [Nitrososphaerota archaeon]|nr:acyl-CoA thioesterase [Nitrososphaerota archaeon]